MAQIGLVLVLWPLKAAASSPLDQWLFEYSVIQTAFPRYLGYYGTRLILLLETRSGISLLFGVTPQSSR